MKKYIVNIYRCEKDKHRNIVGVAEEVGIDGKKAFTSFDELWEILNPDKGGSTGVSKGNGINTNV